MVAELAVVGVERRPDADLRTLATNRPLVRVGKSDTSDGTLYDIAVPDDLSPIRYQRISRLWTRIMELSVTQAGRTVWSEPDPETGEREKIEDGFLTFDEEEVWQYSIDQIAEAVAFSLPPGDDLMVMSRAVFEQLGPAGRYTLAQLFFMPRLRLAMQQLDAAKAAAQTEPPAEPTPISDRPAGKKRSRGSKGSTAEATPSDG